MVAPAPSPPDGIASTNIPGLDDVLAGGFIRNRMYVVEGVPGTGKTTLALQFLMAGAAQGEVVLYVTFSETSEEIQAVARSHGWSLDGIAIHELAPIESSFEGDDENTLFHPSEVELASTMKPILTSVERLKPSRVVFDSLSEVRLLAGNPLRYRRQILTLKQFFSRRQCTVVLLDDMTATDRDLQMQSLAHGVVTLEQRHPEYGNERRRLRIVKYRGMQFRGGYHDFVIRRGGLLVFPRLVAAEHRIDTLRGKLRSDVTELDTLMGGGIEQGTSTLFVGAAGTGKSTLAAQFVTAAAGRGQRGAMFLFDESPKTLLSRCEALQIPLRQHVEAGIVVVRQIDPAELTPGEFMHSVSVAVEDQAAIVVIDSLNGYLNAMPEERFLTIQLHELLIYLGQKNVATILVGAHQGLIGAQMVTPIDATYLADAVLLLRYFEAAGELRQAISIVKKRGSRHERTIREFRLDQGGIVVGEVLREFRGVLTGMPVYEGSGGPWEPTPQS